MMLDPGFAERGVDLDRRKEAFGLAGLEASDLSDDPDLVAGIGDELAHLLDADLGQFLGAGVNEISQSLEGLRHGNCGGLEFSG
jgi:hypothetical protein